VTAALVALDKRTFGSLRRHRKAFLVPKRPFELGT